MSAMKSDGKNELESCDGREGKTRKYTRKIKCVKLSSLNLLIFPANNGLRNKGSLVLDDCSEFVLIKLRISSKNIRPKNV